MKKKDIDLQTSLEAKLEYENKIEHLQKQLKDQSIALKSTRSEVEVERNKQKELQHEIELSKAKHVMLEDHNKKLIRMNEENAEKELNYKNRIDNCIEENRDLLRKIEGLKEQNGQIERDCQAKLAKIEEVFVFNTFTSL